MMDLIPALQGLTTWILPILIAVTLHEAAHGYVAYWCGDRTPAREGRLSLNPLTHVDPVGTVLVPAVALLVQAPLIGWAKPVPVNLAALRAPRRDGVFVALAGSATNLVLATISLGLVFPAGAMPPFLRDFAIANLVNSFHLNLILAVFNMLPILPLDGGRVLAGLLPPRLADRYAQTEQQGMLVILGLFLVVPMLLNGTHPELSPYRWLVSDPANWIAYRIAALYGLGG